MTVWRILKRWPTSTMHLRNLDIAIEIAKGKTQKLVSEEYKLSSQRVNQIYRIATNHCANVMWNIPWNEAVFNKKIYNDERILALLYEYKEFYKCIKEV